MFEICLKTKLHLNIFHHGNDDDVAGGPCDNKEDDNVPDWGECDIGGEEEEKADEGEKGDYQGRQVESWNCEHYQTLKNGNWWLIQMAMVLQTS